MAESKTYAPGAIEEKWYRYWLDKDFFSSVPDDKMAFTIVIPPPNITGVLHMGHMLNNTIQDILIRRARMQGYNACWVPGTDHASIATEAKVVAMLSEKGISKDQIARDEFLEHAYAWKSKYGDIILGQLKKLGASCDWKRTAFTMDKNYSESVIEVFMRLHKQGLIYRGIRMINWDPKGKTAVSDEEVIRREVIGKLYFIQYPLLPQDENANAAFVTIATTRPETIMADVAICIHPDDPRYAHLHHRKALVPLINREIPIILDPSIQMDFGTGCLKVTPAHSAEDYALAQKYHLPVIDILNDDGTLNDKAQLCVGEDRFVARKEIAQKLSLQGYLAKTEDYTSQMGFSERTDAVIEPRLSMQWFLKMEELALPAMDVVQEGSVKLIPDKFLNTYKNWLANIHDWCISRQLWWGHQIPAWYNEDGQYVVAKTAEEAKKIFVDLARKNDPIVQESDVLDTWFSSWIWPIAVFNGILEPENTDFNYYYPTSNVVTGPDILFFWVARMIMSGMWLTKKPPFEVVYLTGIIRDKLGRKMSKSLGNSPDPIQLMELYGADGVRMGLMLCSPAGNDVLFDESQVALGRNFANKLWNAVRLIKGWEDADDFERNTDGSAYEGLAVSWFANKLATAFSKIDGMYDAFRLSDAAMELYKLIWDDFCSWYLELVKPTGGRKMLAQTFHTTVRFAENLLRMLHPFMPFITEELWHVLKERGEGECIIVAKWPSVSSNGGEIQASLPSDFFKNLTTEIRNIRNLYQIGQKLTLSISIKTQSIERKSEYEHYFPLLLKAANLIRIEFVDKKPERAAAFFLHGDEVFVPIGDQHDNELEIKRIRKELEYAQGFLDSVSKKLENTNFVSKAKPEVIEMEQKKKNDIESKIRTLSENLKVLEG